MPDQQLLDAYSKVNDDGIPHFGTCTLIVGDGTMKVDFNNGRAKVPASFARIVARHPQIDIPGLASVPEVEEAPVDESDAPEEPVFDKDAKPEPVESRSADSEALELAKEHLAAEGEEVPDVEVADADEPPSPREGFEAQTADERPRCQAAKADGTQCANPAVEGAQACRLGKHQEQLV